KDCDVLGGFQHLDGGSTRRGAGMKKYKYPEIVIEVMEVDDEWIKPCADGITKESIIIKTIEDVMQSDRVFGISVKSMGERKALIIFPGIQEKKTFFES
ncbi:hypothetical protein U1Q18_003444, partial [Sarracenia purpurea var. burkii]